MSIVFFRLLILSCLLFSNTILACSADDSCIEKSRWHLGIAMGLGVKTNPLVDGDDIPLVVLPDIAWYGEKAYFDNGEIGYQWLNEPKFAFETFLQLDRERAFFSFLHPSNIFIPTEGLSPSSPELPNQDIGITKVSLSIDDIASRKWALNGGFRGHYFLSNGEWQLSFQQDISNVSQGNQVGIQYSHKWLWQNIKLSLRIGTNWKSTRLMDYYYGVSQRDTQLTALYFEGKAGWQTYLSIHLQKPINQNWSWLANIGYRKLPDSLTRSPLVEHSYIGNIFMGVAYRF